MKVNRIEKKLSQFADDTQCILDGTQNSLNESINMLECFEVISGMKVNFDKSEIAKLGITKHEEFILNKEVKFTDNHMKILGINIPINGEYNMLIDLNYNMILQKIKQTLGQWSKRTLTLYGKSTIVKSLILPQMIYQLSNLPTPPMKFLKEIDDLIFYFIWDKKSPKIKRTQLYLDYSNGGLGIPNMMVYSHSLKLKWIGYLANDEFNCDWKDIFLQIYNIGIFIFRCNVKMTDVSKLNIKSKFWTDVLQSWARVHYVVDDNINYKSEHPKNYIWYNSNIKIQNKMIYYKSWQNKGINYIKDLLDQNDNFLDFFAFKNKYDLNENYLKYYGLIGKIRTIATWDGDINNNDTTLNKILCVKSAAKLFYKQLLNSINKKTERSCFGYWERVTASQLNWNTVFERIYYTTIDTKLRNFQFKLIHNIFPDNRILYKMGLVNNELCTFCNAERDSITHYLWSCPTAKQYWNAVKAWIDIVFTLNVDLSLKTVLFGSKFVTEDKKDNLINLILLIAKQYLHYCKWTKNIPSILILKEKVKQREKIEKDIAFQNNKIEVHNKKWEYFR